MDAVTKTYPDAELTEANDISGTVSGEMQQAAIKATLIACVAMLLYISLRFRDFRAGGSAIIAWKVYHTEPEMQIDEYAPATIPTISGSENSLIDCTPRI